MRYSLPEKFSFSFPSPLPRCGHETLDSAIKMQYRKNLWPVGYSHDRQRGFTIDIDFSLDFESAIDNTIFTAEVYRVLLSTNFRINLL